MVVNKPPSIPVHACGQFKLHSIVSLLKTLHGIENLKSMFIFFKTKKNNKKNFWIYINMIILGSKNWKLKII